MRQPHPGQPRRGPVTGCQNTATPTRVQADRVRILTFLAVAALRNGAPLQALRIAEAAVAGPFDAGLSHTLDLAVVEAERSL